jgi:flagellar motor switch protein FliN
MENNDKHSEKNMEDVKLSEEDIQKVGFPNFKKTEFIEGDNSIDLLKDIPMKVVVELGRTVLKIKEILDLGIGSIIELNKLSGEPVDILVNGRKIAKGEVVVIDEYFGVRITRVKLEEEEEAAKAEVNVE